ncbi:hypothetical protein [Streptomyces sp. RP5T]|uniref:hypothetical protein n=1 Tax=Streptomyces sp. RP5T TaxID=2490848 RepID=UPI00163961C1|nr:hypothetical protein [Streptomyces sp. RP5T]
MFITSGVSLLLPTVVRRARLRDASVQEERFLAETTAPDTATAVLDHAGCVMPSRRR